MSFDLITPHIHCLLFACQSNSWWAIWLRELFMVSKQRQNFHITVCSVVGRSWLLCVKFCFPPPLLPDFYHLNGSALVCSFDRSFKSFHSGSTLTASCYSHNAPQNWRCYRCKVCARCCFQAKIKKDKCQIFHWKLKKVCNAFLRSFINLHGHGFWTYLMFVPSCVTVLKFAFIKFYYMQLVWHD